jgi:hypothetical protein
LLLAVLLAVAAAGLGYWVAAGRTGHLQQILQTASTTLLLGTLVGGLLKLLFEDVQRRRERRAEQTRFVTTVLADLKAVYDRVERMRILIPAHQSATTYGDEMRDLIDARVQLRNVIRALDEGSGIRVDRLPDLRRAVGRMEEYLASVTGEFRDRYSTIAQHQRDYNTLTDKDRHPQDLAGDAWTELKELPRLREFLEIDGRSDEETRCGGDEPAIDVLDYRADFEGPLDLASWVLRAELKCLLGGTPTSLPERHRCTRCRLHKVFPENDWS